MSARELLKEAEFMRDVEVASAVAEAIVKFKESEEFTALFKKDYWLLCRGNGTLL